MAKLIDLSQHLIHKDRFGQHPLHPVPYIFPYITHEESAKQLKGISYTTDWLNINSHSATHVDAPRHTDPASNAMAVDEMPLEWCYGPAVCINLTNFAPKAWITPKDLEEAEKNTGVQIRKGDIVLLYTGHWDRTRDTEAYPTDNPGLTKEACMWLYEKGVISFGVDAVTPDNPIDQGINKIFPCHEVLRDKKFPHYENLANLDKVVGKRFTFIGFPLKLKGCSGGPVRAVAILE